MRYLIFASLLFLFSCYQEDPTDCVAVVNEFERQSAIPAQAGNLDSVKRITERFKSKYPECF